MHQITDNCSVSHLQPISCWDLGFSSSDLCSTRVLIIGITGICLETYKMLNSISWRQTLIVNGKTVLWPKQTTTSLLPRQTHTHTHTNTHTHTHTHTHTRIINVFHFKVLAIFWWHSHSSRVKQHLTASVSIIKYFKQHPAFTSVIPSRPMPLSFLSESVSICICHPCAHLQVINRCVRMQNNWCSLGRDWMGLSGAFNQCTFSLAPFPLRRHYTLINPNALWGFNVFVWGGWRPGLWAQMRWGVWVTEAVVILSNITP